MTPIHYSAHLIKIATQKIEIGPGYIVINRMTMHSSSTGTIECVGYLLPEHAKLAPAFLQTCEAVEFVQEFKRWVVSRQPYGMSLEHLRSMCDWADHILKKEI